VDQRAEIREFLASRRGRVTPARAGLPVVPGQRRVPGLRRTTWLEAVTDEQYRSAHATA
jgi:hypothetical protein